MKPLATLILAVMLSWSPLAPASTNYGAGTKTCGTWIEKRRTDDYFDMAQWMLGYISATDYYAFDLKESEGQAFIAYMDNYCQQNPLDEFAVGVRKLISELRKKLKP